jgi:predicted RNA binding protein YcfA (HicA-like mRNA interferase family)
VYDKDRQDKMTFRELERIVKADGWYLYSTQGSHHQYKHPVKCGRVTIPYHSGDLPKFVVNSVLKQAGIK